MDRSLVFLLDRSGSMETCWDDTIGGFNSCMSDQKARGGKLTLIQFDNEILESYIQKDLADIEPLTRLTYIPRGSTALLDAVGHVLKSDFQKPTVIILTDGLENSSKKYTKAHIKDLVEHKTKEGWTFVYLGANQDAFAEAGGLGIGPASTMSYESSKTCEIFTQLSATLSRAA